MNQLIKLVSRFDGSSDILVWLDRLQMLCDVQGVKSDMREIIPLFLDGPAYECYAQMSDEVKLDGPSLKKALRRAFGMDPFEAFEKLRALRWTEGERVEVYLARIKRLATLCEIDSDEFVLHTFVTGLPKATATQLRTQVLLCKVSESLLVEKTKIILGERLGAFQQEVTMPMQKETSNFEAKGVPKCFGCGRRGHFIRDCQMKSPSQNDISTPVCFRCGVSGHVARFCNSHQSREIVCHRCGKHGHIAPKCQEQLPSGNVDGKSPAPAISPRK